MYGKQGIRLETADGGTRMTIERIRKIAVIGAGTMGAQIAELLARVGRFSVNLCDLSEQLVNQAIAAIRERMERFYVSKGKMTSDEMERALALIVPQDNLPNAVRDVDFVIEAVIERLAVKQDVFRQLDEFTPSHVILASNTSYQSITEIGSVTRRPEKVVGMHFFNPVAKMALVEVVKGALTSDETVAKAVELARVLGKEPVVCRDISYGFLANRAYLAMVKEAMQMVWEKVASPEEIDKALRLGYNLPMGPLELFDFVDAWKIRMSCEEDEIKELGPERGRMHPLVRMMARTGYTKIYPFWKEVLSKY